MAKKKTVTIESAEALGEGLFKIINSDGSFIMAIQISEAAIGLLAPEAEEEEEEEEAEEEESVSIEDMKDALIESGVTKKALKKMSDEEIEEAYNDIETEDDDEEEEEEEADDDDDEEEDSEESDDEDDEDSDEDEDDDEEVTPEALSEMDYEELEDLCDDKELDTDPDDFEEDQIEKFRSAVAKELGIKLPKAKKGKK